MRVLHVPAQVGCLAIAPRPTVTALSALLSSPFSIAPLQAVHESFVSLPDYIHPI